MELKFTILEGASFSNKFLDKTSQEYLSLQQDIENNVNDFFRNSSQSSNFLAAYLNNFSADNVLSSGGTVASVFIYVKWNATETNATSYGTAFYNALNRISVGSGAKLFLGSNYVLATSTNGVDFIPSLGNVVVDYDQCTKNPPICGSEQRCENYPGAYRCYCNSPGKQNIDGICKDILSFAGGFVVTNREYKSAYDDTNSIEYLRETEYLASLVAEFYMKTTFAAKFIEIRVIELYKSSLGINYIALFATDAQGITTRTLGSELEKELDSKNNGTFLGPLQLRDNGNGTSFLTFTDYNECNPASGIHMVDCSVNAECVNLEGTYKCSCKEGFTGNGTNCTGGNYVSKDKVQLVKYLMSTVAVFLSICIILSFILTMLSVAQYLEVKKAHRSYPKEQHFAMQEDFSDSITVPNYRKSPAMAAYY